MRYLSPLLDPDRDDARKQLEDELQKAVYRNAEPSLWDLFFDGIWEWIKSLFGGGAEGFGALLPVVIFLIILGAAVAAFIIFGRPRLNQRSSSVPEALFGEDDTRSAEEIRAAAERAARAGDYATAITEMFRAIARGLNERTIIMMSPGTTAQEFSRRAEKSFPELGAEFHQAASLFDGTRYLSRGVGASDYQVVAQLEQQARSARPFAREAIGEAAPR